MRQKIRPFETSDSEMAFDLWLAQYDLERQKNPLLPVYGKKEKGRIFRNISERSSNAGVCVFDNAKMVGFMLTGDQFRFKSQPAVIVPEYAHAAIEGGKSEIYQLMYQELSAVWAENKLSLHLIGHFAHDQPLTETLFFLGFGAVLAERLTDCAPQESVSGSGLSECFSVDSMIALEQEHRAFYRQSATFILKDTDRERIRADLEKSIAEGNHIFVYEEEGIPSGFFIVGESSREEDTEGFLLRETNSAQIKEAYLKPAFEGKGIGALLFKKSKQWAFENGFHRLFVEHETANVLGARFWSRYFSPYLYYSLRYIDPMVL
ncbi:MAG: GNAT family N-acetyltransferase [Thermotogaceae bacterium]|nr:GNAT family N-acetyltransferase [Thermotogaceae bacterium]